MLISEISVSRTVAGKNAGPLRAFISAAALTTGTAALLIFILMLSSAILPPWNVLLVLIIVLIVAAFPLRRTFSRIYAKAQIALRETLSESSAPVHAEESSSAHQSKILEAQLTTFTVATASPAAGKMISELRLRTVSGASVVGIERKGENIVNPGPDEEIQPEDRLLLLGSPAQLQAARQLLTADNNR
jgi:CPA2 family monovalent cation:H+ antiporter-2